MSERKLFVVTLAAIIVIIVLLSSFTYLVVCFRESSRKILSVSSGRTYNSTLIRNFSFDSVLLGTSLSQGFKCSEFDAAFGGKSIKLSSSGANFAEMNEFLKFAVKHKKIKRAMLDVVVQFCVMEQTLKDFPAEYYSENLFKVRLNKATSINGVLDELDFFRDMVRGKVKYTTRDALYDWNRKHSCSEKIFAQSILYQPHINYLTQGNNCEKAYENTQKVLLPIIKTHANIEFIIFFPPVSIMNYQGEDYSKYITLKGRIIDLLLTCSNVKLYDFETALHITTDFNNYKDRIHYSGKINSWMLKEMSKDNYRITAQSKQQALDKLLNALNSFDYRKECERLKTLYQKKR